MRPNKQFLYFFLSSLLYLIFCPTKVTSAQERESKWFVEEPKPERINWDTNYYVSYSEWLTSRAYTSVKYTGFRIIDAEQKQDLMYLTNRNIILGYGLTYSWFTLNIGLNYYPLINNDNAKYGTTNYLDMQTHLYLRKFTGDILLQFYEGYHLANSENILSDWPRNDTFQKRPDIFTINLGYNIQYNFNYKKFSFKAIYNQNEWQKKSAGTWVVGTNFFYSFNKSDSASLIPTDLANPDLFQGVSYKRQDILNVGISGGYYYTLVIKKHFFISVGLAAGPAMGFSWFDIKDKEIIQRSGITPAFTAMFRTSLGYNSRKIFAGTSFLQQSVLNQLPAGDTWGYFSSGNFRIYLVYRYHIGKPIKIANPRYWKIFNKPKKQ